MRKRGVGRFTELRLRPYGRKPLKADRYTLRLRITSAAGSTTTYTRIRL